MGHVTARMRIDRALALACALACAAALGGCGGVELQGKIFDYMGVSGDTQQPDVRMSQRPPLLVPPNLETLPQPGTGGPAVAAARPDWPEDPEIVRKRIAADEKAKEAEIKAAADPTNPYAGKPTLLDRWFKSSDDEEVTVAVPEPDPSDRVTDSSTVAQSQPKGLQPHVPQAPLPEQQKSGPEVSGAYEGMSNPSGNSAGW